MIRSFAWGCLLVGLLILIVGFVLFDRLMEQPRPPVPPAVVTVIVVQTATTLPIPAGPPTAHATKTPVRFDVLPTARPTATPTSTPEPTPPERTRVPAERSPIQKGEEIRRWPT